MIIMSMTGQLGQSDFTNNKKNQCKYPRRMKDKPNIHGYLPLELSSSEPELRQYWVGTKPIFWVPIELYFIFYLCRPVLRSFYSTTDFFFFYLQWYSKSSIRTDVFTYFRRTLKVYTISVRAGLVLRSIAIDNTAIRNQLNSAHV